MKGCCGHMIIYLTKTHVMRQIVLLFSFKCKEMDPLCISLLLLHDTSPQIQQLTTTPMYQLTVCRKEFQAWHDLVLCSGSQDVKIKVLSGLLSHPKPLGKKSTFILIEVIGRIQLLEKVELTEVPVSLLAVSWGHSQLLQAAHMPCHL